LISASGFHNIIFEGVAGCGKSMISKRLRYILPPLKIEEILENAKLDSLNSIEPNFKAIRNFRSPHHSSTRSSIFGGGSREAKIGEIALANGGVLFFDELPHFDKAILEALREPLEDNRVLISRVNSKVEYQTNFLFIGALNPCPCGNLFSKTKECNCSEVDVKRYRSKLSEPLMDRIDIFVQMSDVELDKSSQISSSEMFKSVLSAFDMQISRGQERLNGKLSESDIKKYCTLDEPLEELLNRAVKSFNLSFRSINKILKVARTIADLDGSNSIQKSHLLESISFRSR
jgi:magnesium chelatase family protein